METEQQGETILLPYSISWAPIPEKYRYSRKICIGLFMPFDTAQANIDNKLRAIMHCVRGYFCFYEAKFH